MVFKPLVIRKITLKLSLLTILGSVLISILWCVMPFFGWSYYSLEAGLTSCSVEWSDRSWNVYSYNICIWIFAFIIPLFIMIHCNTHMVLIVSQKLIDILTTNILFLKRLKRHPNFKIEEMLNENQRNKNLQL